MRTALLLLLCACATTSRYEESASCPGRMSEEQHRSGVVRCTALCSSYARDFSAFDENCKCWCAPNLPRGGYRPQPKKQAPITDQM